MKMVLNFISGFSKKLSKTSCEIDTVGVVILCKKKSRTE